MAVLHLLLLPSSPPIAASETGKELWKHRPPSSMEGGAGGPSGTAHLDEIAAASAAAFAASQRPVPQFVPQFSK